jgi:hypothetical protein
MKYTKKRILVPIIPTMILGTLLVTGLSSCADSGKSELVKRLEAIFYDPSFAKIPDVPFNVADYGAIGDGEMLDTKAIQDCIDAAAEAGGGVVSFPRGVFLTGAIFVKSNVELRIDKGVTIKAEEAGEINHALEWTMENVSLYLPGSAKIELTNAVDVEVPEYIIEETSQAEE